VGNVDPKLIWHNHGGNRDLQFDLEYSEKGTFTLPDYIWSSEWAILFSTSTVRPSA
jgi:hypothetical protein